MNRTQLNFVFLLLAGIVTQLFIIPFFAIDNVVPDLITLIVIHSAFYLGQMYGTGYGFFSGFAFDFISGGMIGSGMFSKTLTGFLAGFFSNSYFSENEFHFIRYLLSILFLSSVDSFFYSLFGTAEIKLNMTFMFFNISLLPGLYTTVFSIPFYFFKRKGFLNE
jgi:rod shape-determining protein MreD